MKREEERGRAGYWGVVRPARRERGKTMTDEIIRTGPEKSRQINMGFNDPKEEKLTYFLCPFFKVEYTMCLPVVNYVNTKDDWVVFFRQIIR